MMRDFGYFKDHYVEDFEFFCIYKLEAGPIDRSYRSSDLYQRIRKIILTITGPYTECTAYRDHGFPHCSCSGKGHRILVKDMIEELDHKTRVTLDYLKVSSDIL